MPRFHRNRKDGNHQEITDALEAVGIGVVDLSDAGGGCPDLACWVPRDRRWVFIEVKQRRGRLRESQEEFRRRFPCVAIARTPADALRACGVL